MAAATLRPAILRHIRLLPTTVVPLRTATAAAGQAQVLARWLARPMSSHDAHLTRDEVVDRVLDVLKSHPKVDPSKITPEAHFEKDLGLDSLDTVEVVMASRKSSSSRSPTWRLTRSTRCRLLSSTSPTTPWPVECPPFRLPMVQGWGFSCFCFVRWIIDWSCSAKLIPGAPCCVGRYRSWMVTFYCSGDAVLALLLQNGMSLKNYFSCSHAYSLLQLIWLPELGLEDSMPFLFY